MAMTETVNQDALGSVEFPVEAPLIQTEEQQRDGFIDVAVNFFQRYARRLEIGSAVVLSSLALGGLADAAFGKQERLTVHATEAGVVGSMHNQTRPEATAAKTKLLKPVQIENRVGKVLGTDWLLYVKQPWGNFGPSQENGGTSSLGNIKELLLAPHAYELTGPCTSNGNTDSYLFDSPAGITSRTCADTSGTGRSDYSRSSVRSLCYSIVIDEHEETYAQCDNVNFGQELLKVGNQAAASAGLAANRHGPVRRIEVLSDVKTRTEHKVNAGLSYTEVFLVSDTAVAATIDFADDHNPGHQVKQLEIENTDGHTTDHIRWY